MSTNYREFTAQQVDEPIGLNDIEESEKDLSLTKTNYFSISKKLVELGHNVDLYFLFSPTRMIQYTSKKAIQTKVSGVNLCLYANKAAISNNINNYQLIILRGNYPEWNSIISDYKNSLIFLPCWSKINYNKMLFQIPNVLHFRVLVDDLELIESFEKVGIKTAIFKKPAPEIFYTQPSVSNSKLYDMIYICRNSDRPHKRVDLLLTALSLLDKILTTPLNILLVGNYSSHHSYIPLWKNIQIKEIKHLGQPDIILSLDNSKISLCFSNWDANPRTIGESLARNVPILCIDDLKGGKFQIKPSLTGEFFNSNLSDFSTKAKYMLNNYQQYEAKKHFTTIDESCKQILEVV